MSKLRTSLPLEELLALYLPNMPSQLTHAHACKDDKMTRQDSTKRARQEVGEIGIVPIHDAHLLRTSY